MALRRLGGTASVDRAPPGLCLAGLRRNILDGHPLSSVSWPLERIQVRRFPGFQQRVGVHPGLVGRLDAILPPQRRGGTAAPVAHLLLGILPVGGVVVEPDGQVGHYPLQRRPSAHAGAYPRGRNGNCVLPLWNVILAVRFPLFRGAGHPPIHVKLDIPPCVNVDAHVCPARHGDLTPQSGEGDTLGRPGGRPVARSVLKHQLLVGRVGGVDEQPPPPGRLRIDAAALDVASASRRGGREHGLAPDVPPLGAQVDPRGES
mmetsp:Transcript_34832/g.103870  ORF Transcript_34832/g.103870 Transcript_34832/m.103870 type:complete len:260 (+) Transcript_34832:142-921(+)